MKIWLLLILLLPGLAQAAIDAYEFPDKATEERYNRLIDELRCPMCLNTNLAGSDAMIAQDLRREVHEMVLAGHSDDEILDFMYQRYGDFILYRPRVTSSTWLLWGGPVLLLLLGLVIVYRRLSTGRPEAEPAAADQEKLQALLALQEKSDEQRQD